MASTYGYITVAVLEAYTSIDYGNIDGTYLTDTQVEAKITAAEQLINTYVGSSFTGTIPDGISYATKEITRKMLYNWMREEGMVLDKDKVLEQAKSYLTEDITEILDLYKARSIAPIRVIHLYNNDPSVSY